MKNRTWFLNHNAKQLNYWHAEAYKLAFFLLRFQKEKYNLKMRNQEIFNV